jgi:hypothetical protein
VRILNALPTPFPAEEWVPNLHYDDSLHIATMTSGELDIFLEEGEVTLRPVTA